MAFDSPIAASLARALAAPPTKKADADNIAKLAGQTLAKHWAGLSKADQAELILRASLKRPVDLNGRIPTPRSYRR